jgi:ligand-binding sensor domain-containing protein/anti-sigma regulatory factor (Ser/Thr protein kinase)
MYCFLLSFLGAFAQTDTSVFYPVSNHGVQQMNIRKICVAKDGKLWLSTSNGLASFDGSNIRLFGRGEGGNMVMGNRKILNCYPDSSENLFCLTTGGETFYLHTKTGKVERLNIHIPSEDSSEFYSPQPYTEMLIDNNFLWIGRRKMGFICYNLLTKQTDAYHIDSTRNPYGSQYINTVESIQKDLKRDEILWLGTSNGIYSFNKITRELKRNFHCSNPSDSSFLDALIGTINVSSTDTIWFASSFKGAGCYEIKSGKYTIYPYQQKSGYNISIFQPKNKDDYYIGSWESVPGIFNKHTHDYLFNIRVSGNPPRLNMDDFIADDRGNLWCVIFNQLYVASVQKNKFLTTPVRFITSQSNYSNSFKKVIWDDKRKYYYACFDNSDAIVVLDSNKRMVKSIPVIFMGNNKEEITETNIQDIALDEKGHLWTCGTALSVYDSSTNRMLPAQKLYPKLLFEYYGFRNLVSRGSYLYLQPSNAAYSTPYSAYKAIYRINTSLHTYDSIPFPDSILSANKAKSEAEKELGMLIIDKTGRYAYMSIHKTVIQMDLQTKKVRVIVNVTDKEYENYTNMPWYALDDDNDLWISSGQGVVEYDTNTLQPLRIFASEIDTYHLGICNADGKGVMCVLYSQGAILYDYRNNRQYHLSLADGLFTLINFGISCENNNLFVGGTFNALQYIPLSSVLRTHKERACYIADIQLFNKPYFTDTLPEFLHSITLSHDQNTISFTFSCTEFQQTPALTYRYKLEGLEQYWQYAYSASNNISYNNLPPGNYTFIALVMNADNTWSSKKARLAIHILPAWWQTSWFEILSLVSFLIAAYFLIRWRIKMVRRKERLKNLHEKELLELEAKALRAQMNPHFIFNCMNSIKSLIQQKNEDKAVKYLTTFSKLIRTIFQNSDKREISLFDEIETCRLYTQLESMRFGNKFSYSFIVDETIDLKSLQVPALIIQPFIENAIWHGIVPKEEGGTVTVTIEKKEENILCIIADSGIGRDLSRQNKFKGESPTHQSKGVHLTQNRLDLDNLLNERNAALKIVDKKDEYGRPNGTTVILSFKEY